MNDDPEPSSAARQQQRNPPHEPPHDSSQRNPLDGQPPELNSNARDDDGRASRREMRKAGLKKKLQSMSHLQRSLDMLFFAYLCTLYYMEYESSHFL